MSPFVAHAIPSKQESFSDHYEHLSRFGEWNDNDESNELIVNSMEKNC